MVVDELEPERRFSGRYIAGPIPLGGQYLVEAAGDSTQLAYVLRAGLPGVWGLAAPYLQTSCPSMMARSMQDPRTRLESLHGEQPVPDHRGRGWGDQEEAQHARRRL